MEKTLSETKEDLIRKTEVYKHTIEDQLNELKGDAAHMGKMALIAGGVILVSYFVLKAAFKKKPIKEERRLVVLDGDKYAVTSTKSESIIAREIRRYIIIFLASLAKQKLAVYLQNLNNTSNSEANITKTPELQERWL